MFPGSVVRRGLDYTRGLVVVKFGDTLKNPRALLPPEKAEKCGVCVLLSRLLLTVAAKSHDTRC